MTEKHKKPLKLSMDSAEFDRVMRGVLEVAPKPKKRHMEKRVPKNGYKPKR